MATIYAVVRIYVNGEEAEWNDVHVYSKQTSNLEVIKNYAKEIKQKYPNDRVFVMSREKAHKVHHQFMKRYNEMVSKGIERLYQKELKKYL